MHVSHPRSVHQLFGRPSGGVTVPPRSPASVTARSAHDPASAPDPARARGAREAAAALTVEFSRQSAPAGPEVQNTYTASLSGRAAPSEVRVDRFEPATPGQITPAGEEPEVAAPLRFTAPDWGFEVPLPRSNLAPRLNLAM